MKLGVLFSGGKDSYLALQYASQEHEISCLLTLESEKEDSWMFHTPAIEWTKIQAKSMKMVHLVQKIILNHQNQNTHLLKLQIIQFLAYQTTLYQAHQ